MLVGTEGCSASISWHQRSADKACCRKGMSWNRVAFHCIPSLKLAIKAWARPWSGDVPTRKAYWISLFYLIVAEFTNPETDGCECPTFASCYLFLEIVVYQERMVSNLRVSAFKPLSRLHCGIEGPKTRQPKYSRHIISQLTDLPSFTCKMPGEWSNPIRSPGDSWSWKGPNSAPRAPSKLEKRGKAERVHELNTQ